MFEASAIFECVAKTSSPNRYFTCSISFDSLSLLKIVVVIVKASSVTGSFVETSTSLIPISGAEPTQTGAVTAMFLSA